MNEKNKKIFMSAAAAAVFLLALCYLLYCATPGLYWGDSAEMTAISCDMGVAHSPGYPLYSMVSRVFSWLPLEPYAFRINVMSVFLAALAVALLFKAASSLAGGSLFAGVIAAAGVMGCRPFVEYGLYAEVYALHTALLAGVLLLVAKYRESGTWTYLAGALFLAGVGTAHHFMMAIVLTALLLYMLLLPGHTWRLAAGPPLLLLGWGVTALFRSHDTAADTMMYITIGLAALAAAYIVYVTALLVKKKLGPGTAQAAIGVMLAPAAALLLFGYLPLASARGPVSDWWAPETTANFLNLILLQGYSSTFPAGPAEWLMRLNVMGMLLQVPVMIILVGIFGLIYLFRVKPGEAAFVVLLLLGTFASSMFVKHGKPDALRLPMYVLMFVSAGVGATAVAQWRVFRGAALWRVALRWISIAFVVLSALFNLSDSDWRFMNRSGSAYEFGTSIIDEVRADSIMFIGAQSPSIFGYFESCEPEKLAQKNIKIIPVSFLLFDWKVSQLRDKYPGIMFPPTPKLKSEKPVFRVDDPARAHYAMKLLADNVSDAAVYSDFQFLTEEQGWKTVPSGVVYRVVGVQASDAWMNEMMAIDVSPDWGDVSFLDPTTAANLASVHNERGKVYLERAFQKADEPAVRKALAEFDRAIEITDESLMQYSKALSMERKPLDWGTEMLGDKKDKNKDAPVEAIADLMETGGEGEDGMEDPIPTFYGQARALLDVKAEAMSNKGLCRSFYGQEQQALALMKSSLRISPLNTRLYEALATLYFRGRAPEKSIALWGAIIALDPGNARAYHNIGSALVGMQQKEAGLGYYTKALELDPLYRSAYVNLARLHNKMKNCPAAILTLESARDNFPRDLAIRSELAQQYGDCGMKHLFADEVERIMADFKPDAELYYSLAIIFRRGLQVKNMARSISELKKLEPDFPLRQLFASMDECDRVKYLLEGLIAELPDEPDLRLELSLRTGLCGDEQGAIRIMEGIVRDYPDLEAAKVLLDRFKIPNAEIEKQLEGYYSSPVEH